MAHLFKKHYTREEARELLPQINQWLDRLAELRELLVKDDEVLARAVSRGDDVGGEKVNRYVRTLADIKGILIRFEAREIQIKDLDRGLIDFPAFVGGKEAFLCWEKGEEDIEFWHDLTSGYSGRERL